MRDLTERLGKSTSSGRMVAKLLENATAQVRFSDPGNAGRRIAALKAEEIEKLYIVPKSYLATGGIESYVPEDASSASAARQAHESLERLLSRSLLSGRVAPEVMPRIEEPILATASKSFGMKRDGTIRLSTSAPASRASPSRVSSPSSSSCR